MKCIGAMRKDENRQRLDVIYRVVQKTGLFWGPQNFVKISVEKQTICQNFQNYA